MNTSARYTYEELVAALGEPVTTERALQLPDGGLSSVYVFACSCRAVPLVDGYHIGSPCKIHRGLEPLVRLSDRRCGVTVLGDLSLSAGGLLGMLVAMQDASARDSDDRVTCIFDRELVEQAPEDARHLVDHGILRQRPDGRYELVVFDRFDAATEEWY